MRIKKFIASSLQDGKAKILKELGEDAVILSSRTIKKGDSSREDVIEIVAALDDALAQLPTHAYTNAAYNFDNQNSSRESQADAGNIEYKEFNATASHIHDEITILRDKINEISDNIRFKYAGILGPVPGGLYKQLRKAGFSENFSMNLIGNINVNGMPSNLPEAVIEARKFLSSRLLTNPTLQKSDKRKVMAFIGSTGTGKTTTLIKLAIISKLILGANSLIISADVNKVGGVEQLQTFATIAGIAFRAVYSPGELGQTLAEERNRDFVFIDTTGRSQQNSGHLNELGEILSEANPDMTYLVMSLTSSRQNFSQIMTEYERFNPGALILTKADEAIALGEIFELLIKGSLPVAYITNGQQIPNDIEPADKHILCQTVLDKVADD